jgi:hypothetical protein
MKPDIDIDHSLTWIEKLIFILVNGDTGGLLRNMISQQMPGMFVFIITPKVLATFGFQKELVLMSDA